MDDKLINLIVTVVIIGIWVVQFFLKPKQQEEQHFDEDEDEEETASGRPRNTYAEDPYIQVQEEIRRKIAERKAAEHAASQTGRTKQTQPQSRPMTAQQERPSVSQSREMQPAQRQVQPAPRPQQPAQQAQSIDEIRRRRELAAQGQMRQGNVTVDRNLRPIPQAQLPERAFPTVQAPAHKTAFPTAARSGQGAYHGSTKLRRQANPRNVALKDALRTPGSARQAILLREILDKPVGLR